MQLIQKDTAQKVIEHALSQGAGFCDLFIEKNQNSNLQVLNSKVHQAASGVDFGVGVRLLFGTKVLYGYTNQTDLDVLIKVVNQLSALDKKDPEASAQSFNFETAPSIHQITVPLGEEPITEKVDRLMAMDKMIREKDQRLIQVKTSLLQRRQSVEIFNSEGLAKADERHYIRLMGYAVAEDKSQQSEGYEAPGAMAGWEWARAYPIEQIADIVSAQALIKLGADNCPAGKLPVVLDNGFGGVIFHEACGHLLETTSVQKKASVFWDKKGEMIAHSAVSAIDDGTMPNEWGSINIDDEGVPTQRTQLIKDGVLTNFLSDKVGHMKTGHPLTGSARRQNYRFAPASRMRNTFIEPGEHSLDDLVASIDHGIYCKKMGGGSVQPGTGEFNFAAQESYLIEKGKITKPLKSSTLIGTGPEVLQKISMVGNNFSLAAGMCGSVSGAVPTTVGQPALKIDEILVGGQG